MKTRFIMLVLLGVASSHVNYAMWWQTPQQPKSIPVAHAASTVVVPKNGIVDGAPKSSSAQQASSGITLPNFSAPAQVVNAQVQQGLRPISAVQNIYGSKKSVLSSKKDAVGDDGALFDVDSIDSNSSSPQPSSVGSLNEAEKGMISSFNRSLYPQQSRQQIKAPQSVILLSNRPLKQDVEFFTSDQPVESATKDLSSQALRQEGFLPVEKIQVARQGARVVAQAEVIPLSKPIESPGGVGAAVFKEGNLSFDVDIVQPVTVDTTTIKSQEKPKLPFLDGINKKTAVGESKPDSSQQNATTVVSQQRLTFENLGAYKKALSDVQLQAEQEALKPINRQATELFDKRWPEISEKYTADRQALGQSIVSDRVELLKEQTKKNISQDLINENKDVIAQAVKKAVVDFEARAVKPVRIGSSSGSKKFHGAIVTESTVRSQAENQMRDSIMKPMVDDQFTPRMESVWEQDYKLDYENKEKAQATPKVVEAAKKAYVEKLRLDAYNKLTSQDKAIIKQAGNDAVIQWKLEKESQIQQQVSNSETAVSSGKQPLVHAAKVMGTLDEIKAGVKLKPVKVSTGSVESGNIQEAKSLSPVTVAVDSRSSSPVGFSSQVPEGIKQPKVVKQEDGVLPGHDGVYTDTALESFQGVNPMPRGIGEKIIKTDVVSKLKDSDLVQDDISLDVFYEKPELDMQGQQNNPAYNKIARPNSLSKDWRKIDDLQKVAGLEDSQVFEKTDSNQKIIPVDENGKKITRYKRPEPRKAFLGQSKQFEGVSFEGTRSL